MSEPEDLILEGAHFATRHARALWRRHARAPASSGVPLAHIRTRLELFVSALFTTPIPICAIEPHAPATWLSRLASGRRRARHDSALCATDGQRVYLTNSLYTPWDAQFYPDGIRGWMVKLDADQKGGMALDPRFMVETEDGMRPHQVRLQGGDASSDSFCFPS